ncbi:MAG: N-formylglutamate amidohydrolase [Methyloligellaceae bacterium]
MMKQADRAPGAEGHALSPFTRLEGDEGCGLLLVCDHASNALPAEYGTLGLARAQLERHIGYDIGAAGVVKEISRLLNAPAVFTNFSRLLIDANRGEDDPTLIMRVSDGTVVPGNAQHDERERQRRVNRYYAPYHAAIDAAIDQAIAAGHPPAILSIHTFTEQWRGTPRPWHAGVLWDRDPRLPVPMLEALRAEPDLVAGENVPYTGELKGDCLYRHGTLRGLAHALIEIRHDLVREPSGQLEWAGRLARIVGALLEEQAVRASLNAVRHYGSNTAAVSEPGSEYVQQGQVPH